MGVGEPGALPPPVVPPPPPLASLDLTLRGSLMSSASPHPTALPGWRPCLLLVTVGETEAQKERSLAENGLRLCPQGCATPVWGVQGEGSGWDPGPGVDSGFSLRPWKGS